MAIPEARAKTDVLQGVGIDPEGINQNPAYYTFVLDSAWRQGPVNLSDWLGAWGRKRCGGQVCRGQADACLTWFGV